MRYFQVLILILFLAVPAYGEDMRAASKKAKADYAAALAEARESKERILKDRTSVEKEIARMEAEVKKLNSDIEIMQNEFKKLREKEIKLSHQQSDDEMGMRELSGTVRVVARDLETILRQSQLTARFPERLDLLKPILNKDRFPGIDDFKTITDLFFQETAISGDVVMRTGSFIDRSGVKQTGDILTIGKFTAAYTTGKETGFLRYSEGSHQLFALSALPSWSIRRNFKKYTQGKTEDVVLDFSGGAALRQITHKSTLIDQIKNGGPIVWPILAIGLFAFIIAGERIIFLKGVHANTDRVMGKVNELALEGKWKECDDTVKDKKGRPVCNVLKAGLGARAEERETLESVLQEAILKELPRLERFLPALNIMGAVAPLLGLLGTVTGMISTFHVITLYGTGDPRMMSGGISEALVTTMLGLAVAIPIMLVHTFLSRRVEHIVGDMEEKAVALTNIIHREITFIE
ncbi:MAG: MotA/TolQ/ExbB proton channel family protein [Deltaproteobacteria bacterium]|nr:MotA/TolQ/ExbB proton channel family protein [Deltaproteobacteria bacterium]